MEKSENLEFNVDHQLHPLVTFRDVHGQTVCLLQKTSPRIRNPWNKRQCSGAFRYVPLF